MMKYIKLQFGMKIAIYNKISIKKEIIKFSIIIPTGTQFASIS